MRPAVDRIPTIETHRGVGIHDHQPRERIEAVVRPSIDTVTSMTDLVALAAYAADARNPPEARLFAAARCEAAWMLAAEGRAVRPAVDLDQVRASVADLDSLTWRDPTRYGADLDSGDRAVPREEPLS